MKIALVTTFNEKLYNYYAHRFMSTYNWPFPLYVYHEGWVPDQIFPNTNWTDTNLCNPELKEFVDRNSGKSYKSVDPNDPSVIIEGADYKMDAVRFSYKIFAKTHFMLNCEYDYVFWVDADIFFNKTITEKEVIKKFLPKDYCISFIDRPSYYSECGFVGYNLTKPATINFVQQLRNYYTQDLLFKEREWHDSYVWDCVRKKYLNGHPQWNLAPTIEKTGNPWPDTYMSEYASHLKGKKRKDAGVMLK